MANVKYHFLIQYWFDWMSEFSCWSFYRNFTVGSNLEINGITRAVMVMLQFCKNSIFPSNSANFIYPKYVILNRVCKHMAAFSFSFGNCKRGWRQNHLGDFTHVLAHIGRIWMWSIKYSVPKQLVFDRCWKKKLIYIHKIKWNKNKNSLRKMMKLKREINKNK